MIHFFEQYYNTKFFTEIIQNLIKGLCYLNFTLYFQGHGAEWMGTISINAEQ